MEKTVTVALVGNPNVGKSTLFNALTGMHQHTGNWPGKTVAVAKGICRQKHRTYCFVDLPGTYSLEGNSEDEQVAAAFIESGEADCTVVVCDGSCLERNLILALQVLQKTGRVVVCVNLMDEANTRGICVDGEKLSQCLGVPVVLTAAGRKQGISQLLEQISNSGAQTDVPPYDDCVAEAERIAGLCVSTGQVNENWRHLLDRILVSRRHGIPIMLLLLLGIIWITVWGANYPSAMLQRLFDMGYQGLAALLAAAPWQLKGFLVDGVYATAARVISVMLPPMAIFFPLFTLLEDIGYLPRMAFLLDRGMSCCGCCGKQALTICMGLGCNAVGVMGCRIIDSPKERMAAILTNTMVPCNGRFPTLILLGSLFFPGAGGALLVAACVALGAAGAVVTSGLLTRKSGSTFLMEIPPLRRPRLGQILIRSILDRTIYIAGRALSVAAPAGGILWLLANTSLLSSAAAFLDWPGRLLGMNGVILLAFILSLPANELLIPVVFMAVTGAGSLQGVSGFGAQLLLDAGWSWQMAVCTMVFTLFHWPCATTLLTIRRETGSMRKTLEAFLLPTAVGMVLCAVLNLLL